MSSVDAGLITAALIQHTACLPSDWLHVPQPPAAHNSLSGSKQSQANPLRQQQKTTSCGAVACRAAAHTPHTGCSWCAPAAPRCFDGAGCACRNPLLLDHRTPVLRFWTPACLQAAATPAPCSCALTPRRPVSRLHRLRPARRPLLLLHPRPRPPPQLRPRPGR